MELYSREIWVIMSKCRKYIAKGTPRNRELIEVENTSDNKRILTYSSKSKAELAFKNNGFYTYGIREFPYNNVNRSEYLEAVNCKMSIIEK